jgi:hypothetical protein
MSNYDYLKKYRNQNKSTGLGENGFASLLNPNLIEDAEKRLGFEFPSQLKEFWHEIGPGVLRASVNSPKNYKCSHNNIILGPTTIANILLSDPDSPDCPVIPEFYQTLLPGAMPFFEIGDSVDFLFMYPESENPNAIWDYKTKICDSFEEFIHRLYYESPTFYCEDPKDKPASNG